MKTSFGFFIQFIILILGQFEMGYAQNPEFRFGVSNQSIIDSLYKTANYLRYQSDWISLIEFGNKNLDYLEKSPKKFTAFQKSLISDEIVYAYVFLSDLEKVHQFCDGAISSLSNENNNLAYQEQIAQIYLSLARGYGYSERFVESNRYLDSASHYLRNSSNNLKKYYLKNDIVSNFVELNEPDKALAMAKQCYSFFKNRPSDRGLAEIEMLLGRIYLLKKEMNLSEKYSKHALQKTSNPRVLYNCHESLYRVYQATNSPDLALYHLEKYHQYLDKIFNAKVANDQLALEKKILEQKSEADLRVEMQKGLIQKRLKNYFLAGSLLLSILAIWLFRNRQILHKKNQEIAAQKTLIEDLNLGLEQKVKDRTKELQMAYDEIKNAMQKGQNIERKRIATDLHDNLGSLLSAVSISLDTLDIESLNENEKQLYRKITLMMEDAYAEVRSLSHNLQPAEIENGFLGSALERLIDKLNAQSRIFLQLENQIGDRVFAKNITLNTYAIVLELCNNMLKYSGADEGKIKIKTANELLFVEISDNGIGMLGYKKGQGILNIEQRIQELRGSMTIRNNASQMTSFEIVIPL
ncbi:hypothetical protein EGI22_04880 [Lacihabitans sp. LS3-19]|uniref:ATP-binding protein n=1 Tax=Lacihabitans sp. LS3-19 TaxID=2487335 RepID=UPI0020CC2235|nr:histidine kinase [Lacihabitans sp. LS3-19]MCP9767234.1 hypothetical protein [Lacihabitans sp. LS3-19]